MEQRRPGVVVFVGFLLLGTVAWGLQATPVAPTSLPINGILIGAAVMIGLGLSHHNAWFRQTLSKYRWVVIGIFLFVSWAGNDWLPIVYRVAIVLGIGIGTVMAGLLLFIGGHR